MYYRRQEVPLSQLSQGIRSEKLFEQASGIGVSIGQGDVAGRTSVSRSYGARQNQNGDRSHHRSVII